MTKVRADRTIIGWAIVAIVLFALLFAGVVSQFSRAAHAQSIPAYDSRQAKALEAIASIVCMKAATLQCREFRADNPRDPH